jgi:hypothetical protein
MNYAKLEADESKIDIASQTRLTIGQTQDLLGQPFRLDSITEVPPPEGGEGIWHKYVITQGSNTITGLRSGTRWDVRVFVESMVGRFNERFEKRPARLGS